MRLSAHARHLPAMTPPRARAVLAMSELRGWRGVENVAEECQHIGRQQFRFLQGGEMPTGRHVRWESAGTSRLAINFAALARTISSNER